MRIPLSLRIFLVSAAFTVAIGLLALFLVRQSFQRYYERWERSLATLPAEQLFDGSASEIARSLLLRLEREPEVKERDQDRIVVGLNAILREIPSITSFLVQTATGASSTRISRRLWISRSREGSGRRSSPPTRSCGARSPPGPGAT